MTVYPGSGGNGGFSLLEVLISLLVASVGLMGVAAMDVRATRMIHGSLLRSQAIIQVHEMVDRIHANPQGVALGHYNSISGLGPEVSCRTTASTTTLDCTAAQLAQFDRFEWNTENAARLPSGAGTVTRDNTTGILTIAISWTEIDTNEAENRTFSFQFKPMP